MSDELYGVCPVINPLTDTPCGLRTAIRLPNGKQFCRYCALDQLHAQPDRNTRNNHQTILAVKALRKAKLF